MNIKEKLVYHKRILDRGRNYYGYIQMISTALILVGVFKIKHWYYIVGIISCFMIITYLLGFLDNDKILEEEQKQTAEKNPVLMKILEILKKLEDESKN